jgi:hypothetical protein
VLILAHQYVEGRLVARLYPFDQFLINLQFTHPGQPSCNTGKISLARL